MDGLSFTAPDGKITGLLGPNGAGKTTCLRTLFGLLKADEGYAEVDGIKVSENPEAAKQQVGLFPDPSGLYERLTPREYIQFFAELSGMANEEAKTATAMCFVISKWKILQIAVVKGFQGQHMKTALAQAIVHKPRNIILDEPTVDWT